MSEEVKEKIPLVHLERTQLTAINKRKCEICLEENSKYTCPGCKMKTCSLSCVAKHKKMTGCNGKRNKTEFVSKGDLNNIHLLNDYRFLEEANRLSDNAKRDTQTKRSNGKPTKRAQILQRATTKRNIRLFRMSKGMKRWRENQSQYNLKKEEIFWTIKLIFSDINNKEMYICKVSEKKTFESILERSLIRENPTPEEKIIFAPYISSYKSGDIGIFFKQELDPGRDNLRYTKCDIKSSLEEFLSEKSVLEYPIFHVTLPCTSKKLAIEPFVKGGLSYKDNMEVSSNEEDSSDTSEDDGSGSEDAQNGDVEVKKIKLS